MKAEDLCEYLTKGIQIFETNEPIKNDPKIHFTLYNENYTHNHY